MAKPLTSGPKDKLIRRLAEQVGDKGMAIALLKKRGDLTQKGKHTALTPHGASRAALGAAGRAKDRAAKAEGRSPKEYTYNPKTNRATLKRNT